jgi:multidrug efflux pump subunit AcrB
MSDIFLKNELTNILNGIATEHSVEGPEWLTFVRNNNSNFADSVTSSFVPPQQLADATTSINLQAGGSLNEISQLISMLTTEANNDHEGDFDAVLTLTNTENLENRLRNMLSYQDGGDDDENDAAEAAAITSDEYMSQLHNELSATSPMVGGGKKKKGSKKLSGGKGMNAGMMAFAEVRKYVIEKTGLKAVAVVGKMAGDAWRSAADKEGAERVKAAKKYFDDHKDELVKKYSK